MRRLNIILALLFLLCAPLVCGGQTYYFGRYFTLSKSYAMPGMSAEEIRGLCVEEWGLDSLGFHSFGHPVSCDGLYCSFDSPGVPVRGKPVDMKGNVLFVFHDGGFSVEYTFIYASWDNGRHSVILPPLEYDPGYYISHLSLSNKRTLSLIYEKAGEIFGNITSYFDICVSRSMPFSLKEG